MQLNGRTSNSKMSELLNGDSFYLRLWTQNDAEWYVKSRDEVIYTWTTEKRDLTVEQTISAIQNANQNPNLHCFAIVDNSTEELMGNIALVLTENGKREGEIMYWLAPSGRGQGLATKAVRVLNGWAFQNLELERIVLKTHPHNIASQKVAERAGFHRLHSTSSLILEPNYFWYGCQ